MRPIAALSVGLLFAAGCGPGSQGAAAGSRQGRFAELSPAISVVAPVPAPGFPEGVTVSRGRAYVSGPAAFGNAGMGPTRVWAFDLESGALAREYILSGEDTAYDHGPGEIVVDRGGNLYVLSTQLGIVRIDPRTGEQSSYAPPFPDLPICGLAPAPCSPTAIDRPALPDGAVFDAAGNLYVTDLFQATLWRVPAGGGPASIFFQDARLDLTFGPNGLRLDRGGDTLYFTVTGPELGAVLTLPLRSPTADQLRTFAVYPYQLPDGIAFGESGRLYVAIAGTGQISVLDASGAEVGRFPSPEENAALPIPVDTPAGIAFDDDSQSILVTNHALLSGNPAHFALLRAFVGEEGQMLERPAL